jgi:hypothetical protein
MAKENDDILKANQGGPAADIPDLKKKEKERKKGGAAWSGARGGPGSFSGATGGTVARAAASAALGAAEAGEVGGAGGFLSGLFASFSEWLAALGATLLGKVAIAAAALLIMAGMGALAYALLHGGANGAGGFNPALGDISSSMKIHSGDGDMLSSSHGELRFDPLNPQNAAGPAKPDATADKKPDDKTAAGAAEANPDDKPWLAKDQLAHNLNGAKLSTSLGGDFGGKNIFGGNTFGSGQKFNGGAPMNLPKGQKGSLAAMQAKSTRGTSNGMDTMRAHSGNAFAQLRMSKGMSAVGAGTPSAEGAASAANGAFDQQGVTGGTLNTIGGPGIGDGAVTPPGGGGAGAPDTTVPTAPSTPPSTIGDPGLQNNMNQIQSMASTAGQLEKEGMMMVIMGIALMAVGVALMAIWGMEAIGAAILAIGAMIMGMGFMMEQMASMMAQMANQLGQMVSQVVGPYQGQIVNQCTQQALAGSSSCDSSTSVATQNQVQSQDASQQAQQSTIQGAAPTMSSTGGTTSNGGAVSGTGGSSNH